MAASKNSYIAILVAGLVLAAIVFVLDLSRSPSLERDRRAASERTPPASGDAVRPHHELQPPRVSVDAQSSTVAPASAETNWSVIVVDRRHEAVQGATVRMTNLEGIPVGSDVTNGEGRSSLATRNTSEVFVLTVSAHGFAEHRADLCGSTTGDVTVVLDDAATITGRVVRFDGRPALAGMRVVAWSSVSMPTGLLSAHLSAQTGVLYALTGEDGTFRLDRANVKDNYTLAAGGNGWCTKENCRWRFGAPEPVVLVVSALYGSVVRATLPDGSAPPQWHAGKVAHHEGAAPALASVDYPAIELVIAGIPAVPGAIVQGLYDWRVICQAYVADTDGEFLHGFELTYHVPGYASERFPVIMKRLRKDWCDSAVVVRPTAAGFGELAIVLPKNVLVDLLTCSDRDKRLILEMVPRSAPSMAFKVPVVSRGDSAVVTGVPYGVYDARLLSKYGWRFPRDGRYQLAIGPEPTELRITDAEFGAVLVEVDNLAPSLRPTHAFALVKTPRGTARHLLSQPPYLLYGLPEGEHEIAIENAHDGATWRAELGKVTVSRGEVSRMTTTMELVR